MLDSAPVRQIARAFIPMAAAALLGGTLACGRTPIAPFVPTLAVTRILAFGDSLTEGESTPSGINPLFVHPTNDPGTAKGYPYKLLTLLTDRYTSQAISVYNGGYGGRMLEADATDLPDRTLGEFLDAFSPQVMILMHGANDLNREDVLPNVQTLSAYAGTLVDKARLRGVAVIVSSLPPRVAGGTPNRAKNSELVVPYNAALAAMASAKQVPYVDVYNVMAPTLTGGDLAPDGLHLTQLGNGTLAAVYFNALKSRYETVK